MTPIYGASQQTWDHWELVLECGADLLPVCCQPGLEISAQSVLKTYGKVPSRFDGQGRVVGFPKWTSHQTTADEIAAWSSDDRLGICLQTRRVRALDVDIEDFDAAQEVMDLLAPYHFPVRSRNNSAKFLVLFELEGDYAKQVLTTPDGIIEFLANGQQCVVGGRHSSGAMYEWEEGLPLSLPRLAVGQLREIQGLLADAVGAVWSEGRVRKARGTGASVAVHDPVVDYLQKKGWVRT